jgi:hypothetical protein
MADPDIVYDFHFIKDPLAKVAVSTALETIIAVAGQNFLPPYISSLQPFSVNGLNVEQLLHFQAPAGMLLKPLAGAMAHSIEPAINSLMKQLGPLMSAYGFLMPLIQVIVGIIEVICALMNPFSVRRAVRRLMRKYLPQLIAMFPPLAGVVIIISIIKMILAIVFFILTVVWPMIKLILHNANIVNEAVQALADKGASHVGSDTQAKIDAGKEKLAAILVELANQLSVFQAFLPLLEMITAILSIALKIPCKKRDGDEGGDCCSDDVCPPILVNPPKGTGVLVPALFGDSAPSFAFKLVTTNTDMGLLKPYNQSLTEQLSAQLDESIDACCPAGSQEGGCPNFTLKLTNRRGESITVPVIRITQTDLVVINVASGATSMPGTSTVTLGQANLVSNPAAAQSSGATQAPKLPTTNTSSTTSLTAAGESISSTQQTVPISAQAAASVHTPAKMFVIPPADGGGVASISVGLRRYLGSVSYEVVPNFDVLIARNVISIGCDPEITAAKLDLIAFFPTAEIPLDVSAFVVDYSKVNDELNALVLKLGGLLKTPPYDLTAIQQVQDDMVALLNGFLGRAQNQLSSVISDAINLNRSTITVDKNIVRANGSDAAIVSVTPRDGTGAALLKNVPDEAWPAVTIYTTLGTIANQRINKVTGSIDADLTSPVTGTAQITAKINNGFVADLVSGVQIPRQVEVKFVADSALPTRRRVPDTIDKEPKKG